MDQFVLGLLNAVHQAAMSYTAARYFILLFLAAVVYYILPKRIRWLVLLAASGYFWYAVSSDDTATLWLRLGLTAVSVLASYAAARLLPVVRNAHIKKYLFAAGIVVSALPLLASKLGDLVTASILHRTLISWILPVGLSFYSMQIISYLTDVYRGGAAPERNILRYSLYVLFFPTLIQGPISRYDQLSPQLFEGHAWDIEQIMRGIQLILWGLFLKYMIADKSAIIVNTVFDHYSSYSGLYIWIAAILYSLQLYTDFLSCVTISQGVAGLFGIQLMDNFSRPYFASSVKDFWRRWHISLSQWLRDYVYIPLGGSRRGTVRKYLNLIMTFAVSGIWHGGSWKFLFWGLLHAAYQILGDLISSPRDALLRRMGLPRGSKLRRVLEALTTAFLVMIAWIIFRAESLTAGIRMILSMFSAFNPWILFNDAVLRLGLSRQELEVLTTSIGVLLLVSILHEKGVKLRDWFNRQCFVFRWAVYLSVICCIWVFGTYGYGYNAADFIYGGF